MSTRDSGYKRIEGDVYPTPAWVTGALLPFLPKRVRSVWEPADGAGDMSRVLRAKGYDVVGTELTRGEDFFDQVHMAGLFDAIITNPPFSLASEFVEQALRWTEHDGGMVAMLLRTQFAHAAARRHLFMDCPVFAGKVELTKRIRWIEGSTGSPSADHAWFIWDHRHEGPARISWAA